MKFVSSLIIICICLVSFHSKAQQMPHFSNYPMNNYLINPAVGGTYSFWNVKLGHRSQWRNITGNKYNVNSLNTSFLSIHGPIKYPDRRTRFRNKGYHHGIGGFIFQDNTGPISYTGGLVSYTFHKKISRNYKLSMGSGIGIKQFRIRNSDFITVQSQEDGLIDNLEFNKLLPDANFGLFLYSKTFFAGFTADQLLQNKLSVMKGGESIGSNSKLRSHYFITAGVKFELTRKLAFFPSTMFEYVYGSPLQFDFNARLLYTDNLWFAVAYRHLDAISIVAEYVIDDKLEIGYAYDYTISGLRSYQNGTHEIILGYRWSDSTKELLCPAKFW